MSKVILESKKFSLSYGHKLAIRDISLPIHEKKITAIIGPSGCGKSTYIRAFNRMNELITKVSHAGDILFIADSIYAHKTDLVKLRTHIGMVFQKPNPFPKSIYENVLYGPKLHGKHSTGDVVEHYIKKVA